jgi:hypothetical protein
MWKEMFSAPEQFQGWAEMDFAFKLLNNLFSESERFTNNCDKIISPDSDLEAEPETGFGHIMYGWSLPRVKFLKKSKGIRKQKE